jgi:hypothetical protein
MIYPVPDKKFWIQLFTLATLFLTIKCLWIQEESLRQYKILLIYSCCLMKLIPIFDNLLIIKIHRVCVPLTDLPWHLVSSTPTTFLIIIIIIINTHTHKKGIISRLQYIQEIQISEILQHIKEIQISQVSKCSLLWIPHLFWYTHNKYWTKNKTVPAT